MPGVLKAMRRWPLAARLAGAVAGLALAFLFQIPLETEVPGEPFLLFFLVVLAATLAFGQGVGLLAVALSTFLAVFFFEPGNLALHHAADLVRIELYALLAGGAVVGIARLGDALLAADEAAQAFAQSEQAKAVLLRELAHRVANNFAAVASLIRRKANLVGDAEARSVLNEAVEQVMVLARVHSRLHAGRHDVCLDSKCFLEELSEDLKVLIEPSRPLAVVCTAVSRHLSVAQAIPFGLIVNELVTNAIKHAFPDGRPGTVHVSLGEEAGHLSLCVRDNGVGLDGSRTHGTGVGQELVRALALQLGGELEVKSGKGGSTFCVVFPTNTEADVPAASAHDMLPVLH
jgi:two-component sensor histidine kinase